MWVLTEQVWVILIENTTEAMEGVSPVYTLTYPPPLQTAHDPPAPPLFNLDGCYTSSTEI